MGRELELGSQPKVSWLEQRECVTPIKPALLGPTGHTALGGPQVVRRVEFWLSHRKSLMSEAKVTFDG